MKGTRYSHIRITGAHHTACTKLTKDEKTRLHCIAVEQGISDYELTRRVLQGFIKKYPQHYAGHKSSGTLYAPPKRNPSLAHE